MTTHRNITHRNMQQSHHSIDRNSTLFVLCICLAVGGNTLAHGMEYSVKLSNCYDIRHGFDEQLNGGTPTTSTTSTTTNINSFPTNDTNTPLVNVTSVSAWKCCCWNGSNQDEVECRCEGEALTRVPQTLTVPMQRLTIASAGLPRLRRTGLKVYASSLLDIVLTDLKQLEFIEDGAFSALTLLRTIYISHAPKLTFLDKDVFQGISATIKIIRIINSGLMKIPDLLHLPPENILQMLDLDNNHITQIDKTSITIKTDQLILANNDISYIDDSAFQGSQIAMLSLKGNRLLQEVHPNAFSGIDMQELDLSSTSLISLPSAGLQDIEELRIENTHTLKTIPSIYYFDNLQRAYLTHSFHCCAFKFPSRHDPYRHAERMQEIAQWQKQCKKNNESNKNDINSNSAKGKTMASLKKAFRTKLMLDLISQTSMDTLETDIFYRNLAAALNNKDMTIDSLDLSAESDAISDTMFKELGVFHDEITIDPDEGQLDEYCGNFTVRQHVIECYPMPNALNPCEDVMGYQWLRISVWVVLSLAVVGNVAVLVVILSIRSESSSVPRFLMCHLAFADLCLGLYLLLIASIDSHSMGEYFNYAYDWQYGAGCKVAGFLTVFASHLSVFTLTVITIERWMAITHAMYLNKRIKLRTAAYIMVGGWIFSIVMSTFPLFGISNYSSTSICLPMENRDVFDTVFLISILGLNGVAFCIIAICYIQIYMSLGQETRNARNTHPGEMGVAKKMALLVFTNFFCWAPIAFFGLTAIVGYPLINVTKSKILLVFFYPLNSCADPYLYAILTTQYRQDLYVLLSKFGICKQQAMMNTSGYLQPAHTCSTRKSSSGSKVLQQKLPETHYMLRESEDFV